MLESIESGVKGSNGEVELSPCFPAECIVIATFSCQIPTIGPARRL